MKNDVKEKIEDKDENKKEEPKVKEELQKDKKFKKVEENQKEIKKHMKDIEDTKGHKNKKKWITPVIITTIIIIVGILISTIFALVNINNSKIVSGITIDGIEVSGLTKEEAIAKMNILYQEKKEKEISLKYQEYEASLNPTILEVNYEVENAVNEAYSIGRSENIFINNYDILFTLIGKKNISVDMTLNEEIAKQAIEDIGVNLPGIVIESSYSIEGDQLIITKGKEGICIDKDVLLYNVKEKLNDINANNDYIEIPVKSKIPDEINIEKIHEEIYKEAQDAYYTKNPFTVYPEVEGIDFNIEEARKILEEENDEYIIKLTITKPKVTISQIGSEAFPDQLSIFTTRYDVSDVNRTTNLRIACQKIDGKVVMPGDTFSYNQTLGPRTAAAGYRNAKVYEAGQVVDGIGGGICQISSTLYNAVLMANLEIVERRNHQFVTSYLPAGRDATVVYGMTDFKFKNTRQYPIRVTASEKNGIATVGIYGIKEENEYTFSFSTKTVASIPYTVKYVEDGTLPAGTEKVKQKGANGLKTETYITKMLNGKVISTTLLSRDTYDAMVRIILKGTEAPETSINNEIEHTEPDPQSTTEEIQPETQEQDTQPTYQENQETQDSGEGEGMPETGE